MKNKKGKKAQTVLKQVQTSAQAKIFGGQKNVRFHGDKSVAIMSAARAIPCL